jgi:sec-independent protein translocase protein TatC
VDEREYSLVEHLAELRTRLVRALVGVGALAALCFGVSEQLLRLVRAPMEAALRDHYGPTARFITTGAAEYLVCQMKAALVGGLVLASPWVLYQIWLFVSPGLYDHEKRYATSFIWVGSLCFVGGVMFAYFIMFPAMYGFLVGQQPPDVAMMPSLAEDFSFALKMLVAFGLVFETPVVIFILSLAGIVDPVALTKYRRYVVVIAFIVGAIITPSPDPYSQMLVALPMLALWEVGILVSRLVVKAAGRPLSRKERAEAEREKASSGEQPAPQPAPTEPQAEQPKSESEATKDEGPPPAGS